MPALSPCIWPANLGSLTTQQHPNLRTLGASVRANPWPWWAWPAAYRAISTRPRGCGAYSMRVVRLSDHCRPIVVGISAVSAPTRAWRGRSTPVAARSSHTPRSSTRSSSASRRARPSPWIRSSGCCLRLHGRPSNRLVSRRPSCVARTPGSSSGPATTTTAPASRLPPQSTRATSPLAAPAASPPGVWPMSSG